MACSSRDEESAPEIVPSGPASPEANGAFDFTAEHDQCGIEVLVAVGFDYFAFRTIPKFDESLPEPKQHDPDTPPMPMNQH